MANYVRALDDGGDGASEEIMTSEMSFHVAVHKYKQVVTNYLAANM